MFIKSLTRYSAVRKLFLPRVNGNLRVYGVSFQRRLESRGVNPFLLLILSFITSPPKPWRRWDLGSRGFLPRRNGDPRVAKFFPRACHGVASAKEDLSSIALAKGEKREKRGQTAVYEWHTLL